MELAPFKIEERKGGVRSNCLGAAPFSNITNPIQSYINNRDSFHVYFM